MKGLKILESIFKKNIKFLKNATSNAEMLLKKKSTANYSKI